MQLQEIRAVDLCANGPGDSSFILENLRDRDRDQLTYIPIVYCID